VRAPRDVLMDFDIGYWATMMLALAFVLLGTGMMFGQGLTFENNPAKFSAQVVDLYTTTLGGWSRPIIGTAAFLVMLSTSVTVIDAFPRVIASLVVQLRLAFAPQAAALAANVPLEGDRHVYRVSFAFLCAGALAILVWGMSSFTALVDLATTLSFLTAPLLAFFNHRAIHAPEVPRDQQPGSAMTTFSWASIPCRPPSRCIFSGSNSGRRGREPHAACAVFHECHALNFHDLRLHQLPCPPPHRLAQMGALLRTRCAAHVGRRP
jgi:hypothetical protein